MKVLVIMNPVSGGGRGVVLGEQLCRELASRGVSAEKYVTQRAGDARSAAGSSGFDCIAIVGGDGSVNEAANGLFAPETRLAILPLGTANVVARELRIPRDPVKVAELIASGAVRDIDAGRYEQRRFLLGVGAGLDAAVVEEVHRTRGARLNYMGYVRPVIRVLRRYLFPKITVMADGVTLCDDAEYVVVGNCRYSAGVLALTPLAKLNDGLLDICAFRNLTIPRLVLLAAAAYRPGFAARSDVTYLQAREITLSPSGDGRVPFQVDGDPGAQLPLTLTVEAAAIRVVASA